VLSAKYFEHDVEHLSDVCLIVAAGYSKKFRELCSMLDERTYVTHTEVRSLLPDHSSDPLKESILLDLPLGTLPEAITEAKFRASFVDFLGHYEKIPYHAIHLPCRDDDVSCDFLKEGFVSLDRIAGKTMDIYFRSRDLMPKRLEGGRASWRAVVERPGPEIEAQLDKLQEAVFAVWDRGYQPVLLPPGRFTLRARIAAIATLVTALECGLPLHQATQVALRDPLGEAGRIAASHAIATPDEIRAFMKDLHLRHQAHPMRGYDGVARTLRQLLLPSAAARFVGNTRIKLMVGVLLGVVTFADQTEVVIQIPEAWHQLAEWVTGVHVLP
jgi:hypothetical protein